MAARISANALSLAAQGRTERTMTDRDDRARCGWCLSTPQYVRYHDEEWGVPVRDDGRLFECLVLESAQAGLSWLTILRKREGYRRAFAGFDPQRVSRFTDRDVERLIVDPTIVRNRAKIVATIGNARAFLDIQQSCGSFADYIWGFVDGLPIQNRWRTLAQVPAKTALSDEIAADLKSRGFRFLGSTVVYAHMQATGMVNDHLTCCYRHLECRAMDGSLHAADRTQERRR
jgi:DNA-3-methyladenine glycosylase I